MTTNQAIALCFPMLIAAVVWLTALLVVKPWTRRRKEHNLVAADPVVYPPKWARHLDAALLEADRLIQDVRRRLRVVK
jgi:hypothetical protein